MYSNTYIDYASYDWPVEIGYMFAICMHDIQNKNEEKGRKLFQSMTLLSCVNKKKNNERQAFGRF